MFDQLNSLGTAMEQAKAKIRKETKSALEGSFKELFANFPEIESIRWNQYTPYFMDGDPCVFGVNEAMLKLKPEYYASVIPGATPPNEDDEDDRWEGDEYSLYNYAGGAGKQYVSPKAEEISKVLSDLNKALRGLEEGLLSLGDHITVTVSREGITTEEFEHD